MKKLLVVFVFVAAPAFAQESVVAKYRANYPTPLNAEQKVDLLRHVAVDVHGGLLVKRDGTNCGGYSCDVICFSDQVLFDVLQDQDNAAIPRWDATSNPRGYRCELVAVTGEVTPPVTNPPSNSPADSSQVLTQLRLDLIKLSDKLSDISARIGAPPSDSVYAQHERTYADLTNQHKAQSAELKAAIDSPGWFSTVFGNRYVQLALVGLGSYFATERMKP